ncbi:hypothetical protein C1H46_039907 [Malus baccata]|uniref:Profilin n=1 Tax=Malus baccata TaxID=106549 RepID=A0A540KK50_MALBA|nr:hypothetical protein C1H46_039907 [Malus baccata]
MRHRSYYYKAIVAGRSGSKDSTDTSVSCPDQANPWDTEYEEVASGGLLHQRPMDVDVYLKCHQRKLQILMAAPGIVECLDSLKAISQCVSQVKNWIDQSGDSDTIRMSSTGDMQCLLLSVVYNIASIFLSKKSSGPVNTDQIERSWFIEASIAFCKIQHLNAIINIKTQGSGGIPIKKTSQAMLIGVYDEPVTPGQCNIVVERLGDYLIEQGL